MTHETDTCTDPCPPVTLPHGIAFPVAVDVPIHGLVLSNASDLAELNRLLTSIRRIPQRQQPKNSDQTPDEAEAVATYFWLDNRVQAGEFAAYPGQYVIAARMQVRGIGSEVEPVVEQAMKDDPTLGFGHFIAVHVPDPNGPVVLNR